MDEFKKIYKLSSRKEDTTIFNPSPPKKSDVICIKDQQKGIYDFISFRKTCDLTITGKYSLPKDFLSWHEKYKPFGCEIFEDPNVFYSLGDINSDISVFDSTNILDIPKSQRKIHLFDWMVFLWDNGSVDCGSGRLLINLNKQSKMYGYIASFSSMDEGYLRIVATSFTDLIKMLVDNPITSCSEYDDTYYGLCDYINFELKDLHPPQEFF